ncbi:hypothetical protein [Micromonospora sp. NPDC047074]|uniref:hypothetical protein n=1 Tax=Micromonospora sp. NPDC047074 TaxID=3154339 RepID=UPI0033D75805
MEAGTARFIEHVGRLPPAGLAEAFDHAVRLRRRGGREASRAVRPSASEYSQIDHAVRAMLLPRADELNAHRQHLHSDALSATVIAARAVLKRAKITEAQYQLLVEPFTAIGVEVPTHPEAG